MKREAVFVPSPRLAAPRTQSKRWRRRFAFVVLLLAALTGVAVSAPALHLLGTEPILEYPTLRRDPPVAAVFLSGDMAFRFGMGDDVATALAARGIPVVGVSSPVVFASHKTRAEADAVVADAIRLALRSTGARRVILMGQSYGADIVATAAPDLPANLRARIAAIDLAVPGQDVYFRADPSNLAYLGAPDARPAMAMRALHWTPVICIYGVEEKDSLCPALRGTAARLISLPGGHLLNFNSAGLIGTTFGALHAADPMIGL